MTTKYDPDRHHRRSIRLKGYDYTRAGAYFVTFCVQNRNHLFGEIVDWQMLLNDAGRMVETIWQELSVFYPGIDTNAFVVMPNHFHGIIVLTPDDISKMADLSTGQNGDTGQTRESAPTLSLSDMVHRLKTLTTKRYTDGVRNQAWTPYPGRLWQSNYYEHIIRSEASLRSIQAYIENNPGQWEQDTENTSRP